MTATLIVLSGLVGLAAGPLLVDVARRAVSSARPRLVTRQDLAGVVRFGGSDRSRHVRVVQLASGAVLAGIAAAIGPRWVLPAYLWFGMIGIIVTLTDLDQKLIPNRITLPGGMIGGLVLAAGAVADGEPNRVGWALAGAAGYFGWMLILHLIVPRGMGMGDVKLAPILGGFLAAQRPGYLLVGILGAHLLGGAVALVLLATRIKGRRDKVPFGPFMVAAALATLYFGNGIIEWYLG